MTGRATGCLKKTLKNVKKRKKAFKKHKKNVKKTLKKVKKRLTNKEPTMFSLWDRAKAEDSKRVNAITTEKQRIEVGSSKRQIVV